MSFYIFFKKRVSQRENEISKFFKPPPSSPSSPPLIHIHYLQYSFPLLASNYGDAPSFSNNASFTTIVRLCEPKELTETKKIMDQLLHIMFKAVALLNDEDVDANSSSSSKRPSTFLNFVALGNTSAGKSTVLNSLIGHPALPTGEGGATRAPICIELKRDGNLSSTSIVLQTDRKSQPVFAIECVIWLSILTLFISILSEYLINTIEGASVAMNISISFISVILLPIVGNAAEHASAIMFAMKDKLIPFYVIVGWIMGHPFDLNFQLFETTTLIITVIVVAFMLQDGTSNYFKGVMLVFCYLIVVASFFVHIDPLSILQSSGTTMTFVIVEGSIITVASVGDSRCILERESVPASGGEVGRLNVGGGAQIGPLRCWPHGLCLSISIGDLDVGEFIVLVPYVKQVNVSCIFEGMESIKRSGIGIGIEI
ncbi:unnamed protein product [Lactuca saligna]|uniref:Uncharacterized protein n=1 Tax=Lactuca saligna TaxID=75948 RepID=A0AA35V6K4_LACSI|nr:unnamed protein product [Lactuca saligna]